MMKNTNWTRRTFLRQGLVLGIGAPLMSMKLADRNTFVEHIFPLDGDMLHAGDGEAVPGGRKIKVTVMPNVEERMSIRINDKPAVLQGGIWSADVVLSSFENRITVSDTLTGRTSEITVFRLEKLDRCYRVSIDDAVWFLKDIAQHADKYTSIFDNPFMGFLRSLHRDYGTKSHLNLFFETTDFDLTQMPDKFKPEWRENADWIRLSVHARSEFPDDPYIRAGYYEMKRDCQAIRTEIMRFAGEEVMDNTTTLHWGQVPVDVCRALRDEGYTVQVCDFNVDNDLPPCSYYLSVPQRRHMNKRFIWRDNREKIIFVRSSIIINNVPLKNIDAFLDSYGKANIVPPYVDLLNHEQYFYPFYRNYQPDYRERMVSCVRWAQKHGYKPAFIQECVSE